MASGFAPISAQTRRLRGKKRQIHRERPQRQLLADIEQQRVLKLLRFAQNEFSLFRRDLLRRAQTVEDLGIRQLRQRHPPRHQINLRAEGVDGADEVTSLAHILALGGVIPTRCEALEHRRIIELTDDDGVTTQFEYLTTIDHEGELYVVLMVLDNEETDDEEGEVLILKIEKDPETDEDIYVSVDDDAISQAVFDKFLAMMDEEEE